jgi:hypothetical protein
MPVVRYRRKEGVLIGAGSPTGPYRRPFPALSTFRDSVQRCNHDDSERLFTDVEIKGRSRKFPTWRMESLYHHRTPMEMANDSPNRDFGP